MRRPDRAPRPPENVIEVVERVQVKIQSWALAPSWRVTSPTLDSVRHGGARSGRCDVSVFRRKHGNGNGPFPARRHANFAGASSAMGLALLAPVPSHPARLCVGSAESHDAVLRTLAAVFALAFERSEQAKAP
jgi:hypothetical protein